MQEGRLPLAAAWAAGRPPAAAAATARCWGLHAHSIHTSALLHGTFVHPCKVEMDQRRQKNGTAEAAPLGWRVELSMSFCAKVTLSLRPVRSAWSRLRTALCAVCAS